jgi:hypothetical protein
MKLGPNLLLITKVNLNWVKDLNAALKLTDENISEC